MLVISSYCLYNMISWMSSYNVTGIFCPDNLGQQKSKRAIKSGISVNQGRQDGKAKKKNRCVYGLPTDPVL